MSQPLDADLLDDLGEPEGSAFPRQADEAELGDFGEGLEADLLEAEDLEADADAMDALEEAVTEALDAEDADEFLGGLWNKVKSVAKKVAPIVSQVAPLLPIPGAGLIGKAADVIGQVAADEADELDAIDGMIDIADDAEAFDAAAPVVAGLAIKKGVPNIAAMPHQQRKHLVKATAAAARHVARHHGPEAVAALPAIVQQARRTAVKQGIPSRQLPHLVRRTAAKVAQAPHLVRRFANASAGLRTAHPMGTGRRGMGPGRSVTGGMRHAGYPAARTGRYGYRTGGPGRYGSGYGGVGSERRITLRGPVRITVETI
jgi:hypothetical protein